MFLGNELKPLNEVKMKIENINIIKCDTAISIESLFPSGAITIQNGIFTENSVGIIVKKSHLNVYFNKSSINGGNFGFSIGESTVKLDVQNCLIKNVKSFGFNIYNSRLNSSIKETLMEGNKVGFRANSGQSLSLNVENCTVTDNTDKTFSVRNIHNLYLSIIHTGFERNRDLLFSGSSNRYREKTYVRISNCNIMSTNKIALKFDLKASNTVQLEIGNNTFINNFDTLINIDYTWYLGQSPSESFITVQNNTFFNNVLSP